MAILGIVAYLYLFVLAFGVDANICKNTIDLMDALNVSEEIIEEKNNQCTLKRNGFRGVFHVCVGFIIVAGTLLFAAILYDLHIWVNKKK